MEPSKLGRYEVRRWLGQGSMGKVYEAWDPILSRRVAIKTVRLPPVTEAQEELARFRREARMGEHMSHPSIVAAYDYGETADLAYIVMEFVDGCTLKSLLEGSERLSLPATLRVLGDVLAALEYIHGCGVVHRDIKPANIILTAQGRAKVADFGIARVESSKLTQVGTIIGAPAYMSPEQFTGQVVDHRTDIWACGVLLYQLLTGERPFEGSLTSVMHQVLNTEPLPPSERTTTMAPALDAVVACAMAKHPDDRYGSAAEFARAIRNAAAASSQPCQPPSSGRRAGWLSLSGVGLGALGVVAWLLLARGQASKQLPAVLPNPPGDAPARMQDAAQPLPAQSRNAPPPAPEGPPMPERALEPARPSQPEAPSRSLPDPQDALRAAVAAELASIPCVLLGGDLSGSGKIRLTGLARDGTEPAIRAAVERAAAGASVEWDVVPFADSAGLCTTLDVVRPIAGRFGAPNGLTVSTADERTAYRRGDRLALQVDMPPFAAFLRADYVSETAMVNLHPAPNTGAPLSFSAGAHVRLGDKNQGFPPLLVPPLRGAGLVVVFASAAQLFAPGQHDKDLTETYKRFLASRLVGMRYDGTPVAAALMLVTVR